MADSSVDTTVDCSKCKGSWGGLFIKILGWAVLILLVAMLVLHIYLISNGKEGHIEGGLGRLGDNAVYGFMVRYSDSEETEKANIAAESTRLTVDVAATQAMAEAAAAAANAATNEAVDPASTAAADAVGTQAATSTNGAEKAAADGGALAAVTSSDNPSADNPSAETFRGRSRHLPYVPYSKVIEPRLHHRHPRHFRPTVFTNGLNLNGTILV